MTLRAALTFTILTLTTACSDDTAPTSGPDGGAIPDAGVDAALDAAQDSGADLGPDQGSTATCKWVDSGVGPAGTTKLSVTTVATGLEVPWALAFPSSDDILVTEMAGRVRLIRKGALQSKAVLTVTTPGKPKDTGQGLHGMVLHPKFATNRYLYLHHTYKAATETYNKVSRYKMNTAGTSATLDRVILDKIPAGFFHNGGRMRFGPDGMLWISTGDSNDPDNGKKLTTMAGKLLRITGEGKVPADNPWPGNPAAVTGIRNSQGFDFLSAKQLYIVDHGPSGEFNRTGQDELTLATLKDDLGWPAVSGCTLTAGKITPSISWKDAVPPGSMFIYKGNKIPGWKGSVIMASLGQQALLRIAFAPKDPRKVTSHEVYFQGGTAGPNSYGRIRAAEQGPDGHIYVTTSNCDDHGTCNPKDKVLRITSP